jgi:hypothetical protein
LRRREQKAQRIEQDALVQLLVPGAPQGVPGDEAARAQRTRRACALSSGSTVISTVGTPSISMARCTVTTVR